MDGEDEERDQIREEEDGEEWRKMKVSGRGTGRHNGTKSQCK